MAGLSACDSVAPPAIPFVAPPPNYTPVYEPPFLSPDRLLVADFDDTLNGIDINSNLFNPSNTCPAPPVFTPTPGCTPYSLPLAGTVTLVNNFESPGASQSTILYNTLFFPGANGSTACFRAGGLVKDGGNGKYPTLDLQAQMNSGAPYDASFFSGVRFYINVSPNDDATKRIFAIPIYATQEPPAGGCVPPGCYDHFFVNYENTNGQWRLMNVDFLSMGRQGFGPALSPNTLSGNNLKQVLWLMWQEGRNNSAGTSTVEFMVDSIEFY
jgi:hypothetical protein